MFAISERSLCAAIKDIFARFSISFQTLLELVMNLLFLSAASPSEYEPRRGERPTKNTLCPPTWCSALEFSVLFAFNPHNEHIRSRLGSRSLAHWEIHKPSPPLHTKRAKTKRRKTIDLASSNGSTASACTIYSFVLHPSRASKQKHRARGFFSRSESYFCHLSGLKWRQLLRWHMDTSCNNRPSINIPNLVCVLLTESRSAATSRKKETDRSRAIREQSEAH